MFSEIHDDTSDKKLVVFVCETLFEFLKIVVNFLTTDFNLLHPNTPPPQIKCTPPPKWVSPERYDSGYQILNTFPEEKKNTRGENSFLIMCPFPMEQFYALILCWGHYLGELSSTNSDHANIPPPPSVDTIGGTQTSGHFSVLRVKINGQMGGSYRSGHSCRNSGVGIE